MKLEYDKEADAAYIYLKFPIGEGEAKKTIQVNDNIILDFDSKDRLIGIEILDATKVLKKDALTEAEIA